jgi:type IX secretion system PorP/SprF family membrane protein
LLLGLFFLFHHSCAQDQTNFTQFYLNPYLINASYAGIDGQASVSLLYRNQWSTINGGPRISNLSLHVPVNKRTSVGFSVTNDKKGLLDNSALLLTFGYNVPLEDHAFLRFGISGGGSWNTVDLQKLEGINDPAMSNLLNNNASLAGNAGISIHLKSFHAGVSLPVLFEPSYVSTDAFSVTEVKPFESLILHVSNRFYFNKNKNVFEPYAVYRMVSGLPPQFEVAGIVHLNHVIWAGGSYKQDFGISALGGIKVKNILAIGGSYSLKNSGMNELNSPSYEISLGYLLGKHKKDAPVYSFVNTVKEKKKKGTGKSASEMIAEKHRQDELARKKREELARKTSDDAKKKQQEEAARKKQLEDAALKKQRDADAIAEAQKKKAAEPPPVGTTRHDTIVVAHRPRFNHIDPTLEIIDVEVTEHTPQDEQERISRITTHAQDPDEHHEGGDHPNAERHEFAKRGSHQKELNISDYVVAGVFKEEPNARHFVDGLKKLGFKANYGHLTEKKVWYVYLHQSNDINRARGERDKFRKMKIFRDAWLLTVQH